MDYLHLRRGGARVGLSVKFSPMNLHVPIAKPWLEDRLSWVERKKKRTFVLGSCTLEEHNREKHPEAKYGILINLYIYLLTIYQAVLLIFK